MKQNSVALIAAALKLMTREAKDVEVNLTPEAPLRAKKKEKNQRRSGSGGYSKGGAGRQQDGRRDRRSGNSRPNFQDKKRSGTYVAKKK